MGIDGLWVEGMPVHDESIASPCDFFYMMSTESSARIGSILSL